MKRTLYLFVLFVLISATYAQTKDPAAYDVIKATGTITVDGNLNEAAWGMVPASLLFGPESVNAPLNTTTLAVTGGVTVVLDPIHGLDSSYTILKVIKQGMKLYIGFTSNDKSVCRFGDSWEGDGLFMKIKNAAGADVEYKLYYNLGGANPDVHFEGTKGMGAAVKGTTTVVNDTTQEDNGYSAEMVIYLDSLGYTAATKSVQVMFNIFDPDYYNDGMLPWAGRGTFHKSFWGSEWGAPNKTLIFKDDPESITALTALTPITVDGKLDESAWNEKYEYLLFGPGAVGDTYAKTVTGGTQVKNPWTDTTFTSVKFLRDGTKLYIGFTSNDKSVGKFGDSWEGDGIFMKIKNAANEDKEFKLYFNASGVDPNMVFEQPAAGFGAGVGVKGSNTIVNDTTQIDNGYSAEMVINLDQLGYTADVASVPVMINVFDPDGYHNGMVPWGEKGGFNKTWWGSEWGPVFRSITLSSSLTPVELTSFTATVVKNNVELNWATATERNNKVFEVQRKADNSNFVTIGIVSGKGTTTEKTEYSYVDKTVVSGTSYSYRLKQVDFNGQSSYSAVVNADNIAPVKFALGQNYPNPFNPTSKIEFAIPVKSNVTLQVYNLIGQVVMTIANGQFEAGTYTFNIDASKLSSGVYLYSLSAGSFNESKKMIVLK